MAYMVGTTVSGDGEGKPIDNRPGPTAHLSSKLTERLSLRNNTQANYHHILRWSHQCKNKSQRQGNWQSHHVLLLDQT